MVCGKSVVVWRFQYDGSNLHVRERNREFNVMRWIAVLLGVSCVVGEHRGAAQATGARVSGRVTMLEKANKPSRDLGAAVVSLEGAGGSTRPATVAVAVNDKEFAPRVVVVPVGSTVRFPNHDPFDHNVFSASTPNQFDLGQYGRGETKAWVFTHPGLVRVFCNIHPRMVAFVHILAGPYFAQPAADGTFLIDNVPPGAYTLHVWHERSPEVTRELSVAAPGVSGIEVQLDARGFRWVPHKNKYGEEYPSDAGERY